MTSPACKNLRAPPLKIAQMFSGAFAEVEQAINAGESVPVETVEGFLRAANELALNCNSRVSGSPSNALYIHGGGVRLRRIHIFKLFADLWREKMPAIVEYTAALSTLVMREPSYNRTSRHAQRLRETTAR